MVDGATVEHSLPTGVVHDADRDGRVVRVSVNPRTGRIVVSTWQDATCLSTVRLDRAEAVELLSALGTALLPPHPAR